MVKGILVKYTENQIIDAMQGTGGIVNQILKNLAKLGTDQTYTRNALYDRIDKSESLKEAYVAEQERIGDLVETGFFRAIGDEKEWAMKEWFRYKGWSRGYVQKQEQNTNVNIFSEILTKYGGSVEGVIDEVPRPIEIAERPSQDTA